MARELINIYENILNSLKYHFEVSKTQLNLENDIVICDERSFQGWFENEKLLPTTIYIIVAFNEGSILFGNTVIPISFIVYSEQGTFENARLLLTYFATEFNFAYESQGNVSFIQSYSIPTMREEFAEEGNSFRAIFDMSGTFVYGENVSGITELNIDGKKVRFLNIECTFTATPNSANLGDKNDRTTTVNASATFSMSVSVPSLLSDTFVSKVDSLIFGNADINTTFEVTITKGGVTYPTRTLHFIDIHYSQEITNIPIYAIGLGE